MKIKLEIGFIVIIITVFIIIVISGVAINSKLSNSIEEINQQHHQNVKTKLIKDVNQQLLEAENLVYSFNLTKNNNYLRSYYSVNSSSFRKINKLYNITQKDTFYSPLVDSVNLYAKAKIKNLGRILILQNQYRVSEAMTLIENEANKIKQIRESEQKNPDKKKFSLFRKSSKDKNLSSSDAINNRNAEIYNFQNELKEIKNFESSKELKNNAEQFSLMQENKSLMQKFNSILQTLDKKEKALFAEKQRNSKTASLEVKFIVLIFSILSTILLLFALYIIFQYIVKNNKYKNYLREAKIQSEELAASKARFLSNMSHEIRTPLNAIIGFSDLLEKNAGNSSREVKDQIEIINKSSKHLAKIINEVLDFSKLESKKMVVQEVEFNPSAEVSEVIEILSASAHEKNNQLEFKLCDDLPPVLYGDQLKLKQILFNLIGNAIKFTENGKISCEQIQTEAQEDGTYLFKMSIIDTGVGISKAYLSKIFHEFVQDENKSYDEKEGTGLGLSITKLLLETLNGKIDVESEEGVGAVFTFEITFNLFSSEDNQVDENHKKIDLSHKHILIVDDEKYNRKLIFALLKNSDALIFEAENGKVALNILKEKEIDLVFLDLKMPVMDGFEFMEKFKVSKHSDDVKIIALTALELETDAEKELFDDYILKPINGEMLIKKINKVFRINAPVNSSKKTEQKAAASYNLEQLKSVSNGDLVFYKDMVNTLIDSSKKGVLDLKIAYNAHDLDAISEAAHKMCSPFKHISALGVYSLLKELERDSKTMDINLLEGHILKTEQEIDKLIELLNKEL